jgi:hypothetical protein
MMGFASLYPSYARLNQITRTVMATTMFFEKVLHDQANKVNKIRLEFGRSSFTGENLIYFVIDGRTIIVDKQSGIEIYEAITDVAHYLGYDKRV